MEVSPHLSELISELEQEAIKDGIQKRVVGAVIAVRGKILVMIRSESDEFLAGYTEIPGGGVDGQENLIEALCREMLEETGMEPSRVVDYLSSFDYISGSGKKTRQFNFLVTPKNEEVALNPEEHSSYSWVSPEDEVSINKMHMSPEMRETIRNVQLPPNI